VSAVRVHNLTFHGVGVPPRELDPGEAHVWLSEERFLAVLDAVRGRADVRISFDDSFRSDVDIALPALLERGMTATFFVLAGRFGHPEHLGERDLRELHAAGMTIGSHGLHHRNWRRLDDGELTLELEEPRRILAAAADAEVSQTSVPFGAYDRHVLGRLRAAGYDRVFTSDGGPAQDAAWLQPRTSVTVNDQPSGVATAPARTDAARDSLKQLVKRWR
jgi:peptidoglycan/xylan/chitin deacetylase (PgdA/CDA1 family)